MIMNCISIDSDTKTIYSGLLDEHIPFKESHKLRGIKFDFVAFPREHYPEGIRLYNDTDILNYCELLSKYLSHEDLIPIQGQILEILKGYKKEYLEICESNFKRYVSI